MLKSTPIELANVSTIGTSAVTYRLSTLQPGTTVKRETKECCVVVHLSALSGTSPTMTFDVYETVDGSDIHVGTTGAMSSADDRIIDSAGGNTSSGATFTSSSMLRLLGKGVDMKVVATPGGTAIGTVAFTLNAIFYDG